MGYLLGIDGGGTHTTACLADGQLSVLSRVQVGPSNPIKVGMAAAQRELARAYRLSLREAHIQPAKLDAVCAGLAGGDSASVRRRMLPWLRKSIPARARMLTTDAAVTLAAALDDSEGIIVIAGTGSIAYGRDKQGRVLRAGGWGSLFDDEGSGYDLGRKAVACALRAFDRRGRPTTLADSICRELGLGTINEIVPMSLTARDIAALFPLVQAEARAGDLVARSLCREAGAHLADLVSALITQFRWKRRSVRVICSGGVFQASPMIRRFFTQRVHDLAPGARVSLLRREPVQGALLLASKLVKS